MTDNAREPKPLPKFAIAIASDGLDAEITIDGRRMDSVRRYKIEHERDDLCRVTLEIIGELSITGPADVVETTAEP